MTRHRHNHDHPDEPERLLAEVEAACADRGLRLTELRRRVLELVARERRPVNAFTACHHPRTRHTVPFLICDVCAGATELCDDRVSALLDLQAREAGFLPEAQTLEVHGVCRRCREGRHVR
ncbi:MAG: hypothetical protein ACK55W_04070 [Pseudomonadota bacterium]